MCHTPRHTVFNMLWWDFIRITLNGNIMRKHNPTNSTPWCQFCSSQLHVCKTTSYMRLHSIRMPFFISATNKLSIDVILKGRKHYFAMGTSSTSDNMKLKLEPFDSVEIRNSDHLAQNFNRKMRGPLMPYISLRSILKSDIHNDDHNAGNHMSNPLMFNHWKQKTVMNILLGYRQTSDIRLKPENLNVSGFI